MIKHRSLPLIILFATVFLSVLSLFLLVTSFPVASSSEQAQPYDRIAMENIHVYSDKVLLDLSGENVQWATYAPTQSMVPFIQEGYNGIEIKPKHEQDIHVGDVISFTYDGTYIVHRVVDIGEDKQGWYAITKGDNLAQEDPGKRRFNDVNGVLVAVIF